mmetsp:Transcript_33364/g.33990  ORF Transcript_33364/g.33990 Transcript_33364/m.33990 type:complete len:228 (-) Transcript_33364:155-838(-)|eukprot:CAMPEP_0182427290 /NCGR_PEP_ID=MMETSP1167-20130531/16820_1 /TAXON_ID=2988 /ORGANISM="Mallomonas Sp, Strain CCMP3275" /LENGTH=227 /DNA_ID=CAMNT_0024609419 /DNA_START=83 /DNA_END=766 /DNA_ORIENTATION=+
MEPEMNSSAFGFKNIRARTRRERTNLKDRVALEKQRLTERVGYSARLNQANTHDSSSGLTTCPENGAGYLSNADRFHSDTSGEEYLQRQEKVARKQRALEFRKNQGITREEDRWNRIDQLKKAEEERVQKLREAGIKAKKNESGVAYNITNLQYMENDSGKVQQYSDDLVRYRAKVRTQNLVTKGDTRVGYNIISGTGRDPMTPPEQVNPPEVIRTGRARLNRGLIG